MSALAAITRPAVQSSDDVELVAAVRDGDDRAFELLFKRYQARIAAYVRGMVRDHGRAEDVTQEVFIAALRRIRATDSQIDFKPWIFEIAKNACIDAFRRGRNTHEVSFDADDGFGPADQRRLAASAWAPDTVMDTKLALDDLCGAFGGLSQTHHDILVMREFDGLSYREIGEQLCMTQGAVESTLFRARRRLGEEYEEIASGERCTRVRGLVDSPASASLGLREHRRMCRHVSHCQPCRRYALHAGVDIGAPNSPASRIAKVAAVLPLPAFLRRRNDVDQAGQLFGAHPQAANIASALDPATVSGWGKAIFTAAAVAVAGLGAGAAVDHRGPLTDSSGTSPTFVAPLPEASATDLAQAQPAPEPVETSGSERPSGSMDPEPGTGAVKPEPSGSADRGSAAPKKPNTPPAGANRPASATKPSKSDAKTSGASSEEPAAQEPAKGPLQTLLGGRKDTDRAAEKKPLPGIVKGVVGLLESGGLSAGAPGATGTDSAVHTSGGEDPVTATAHEPRPRPLANVKPVKVVDDLVQAVTAGSK